MKNQFPGYFSLPKAQIKKLWDEGLFVFDANILLGLYRYSDATRKEFFATLDAVKERCWIPHQAAKEYFDNRLSVIGKQEEAYVDIVKSMDDIENKFKSSHQHPFLSPKVLDRICKDFEIARDELEKSKSFHTSRITDDDVLAEIERIFRDRIGLPYSDKDLSSILVEGEERYKKNIPPGFRDGKKDDSADSTRRFGDLILWKQILDKAKADKQGVIFVCDDRKDDWWLQFKGKTLGPRPELIKEFIGMAGTNLHIYSSDRFLEFAGEHFERKVSEVAVTEMRELKRFDEEKRRHMIELHKRRMEFEARAARIDAERQDLGNALKHLEIERSMMEHSRQNLARKVHLEDPAALTQIDFERLEEFAARSAEMDHRMRELRDRLQMLDMEQDAARSRISKRRSQQNASSNPYQPFSFDDLS